jgi:hypothetical protein
MRYVDVFNGDADGLASLQQLRLAEPVPAGAAVELVTGLKHEIELLARVDLDAVRAAATAITVLDVSLDRNRAPLERLLEAGAAVRYFDHHFAGAVPVHPGLQATIDPAADICTGILVDRHLEGRHRRWAIVAAFGDNLVETAQALADGIHLDAATTTMLRELGEALNYNAYGDTDTDVLIHPRDLYRALHAFEDPVAFHGTATVRSLRARQREDVTAAMRLSPAWADAHCAVYRLPSCDWARRVIGTFANALALAEPGRAHAVLKTNADGTLNASVRAPLQSLRAPLRYGADWLCRKFPTGGGRAAAAGIDRLPEARLDEFIGALRTMRWE